MRDSAPVAVATSARAGLASVGASFSSVTATSKVRVAVFTPSLASTSTETVAASSWSSETPSARRRVAFSTTKRGSLTVKVMAPSSGSAAPSVPTTAPGAFSATAAPVSVRSSGASSTSATATVSVALVLAPAPSVATTSTDTVAPASKFRLSPAFRRSSLPTTSNGEAGSTAKVIAASSPSGSIADRTPTAAPSAFSATGSPARATASGAAFGLSTRVRITRSVRRSSPSAVPVSERTVPSST